MGWMDSASFFTKGCVFFGGSILEALDCILQIVGDGHSRAGQERESPCIRQATS